MNARQVWRAALGELQLEVSKANFETWLKNTVPVALDRQRFVIGAPTTFAREWLEQRMLDQIGGTLRRLLARPIEVQIVVHQPSGSDGGDQSLWSTDEKTSPNPNGDGVRSNLSAEPTHRNGNGMALNPNLTFESFIVGNSNRLAHAAALAVAESSACIYNPLFFYGGVGLGKTHLLHAIGQCAGKTGRRSLYVSSERFTNDLVNSIRGRRTEAFRQQYRNCDVLLVDDIQFLAGREGTQEEFFHTFNELHGAGKQIVISSDRPPKSIKLLEERLRSRFEWGLIADIQPPELETRTAILDAKAMSLGATVPRPVIAFLARRIQRNVRELEGCLTRVIAFAELHHQPVTVEIATSALASLTGNGHRRLLQPNQILEAVASQYQVSAQALIGKQRHQKLALPRHVCMYLLREELDITLEEVGRVLGGRDHSTVIHGSERIAREMNADSGLRSAIAAIREMLYKK